MIISYKISGLYRVLQYLLVLGTCATFSATAPLARTKKGGGRRGGAKVKNNGAATVARKKVVLIRAIYKPNFA